jgi:nucleotide-binding universal stress UspA family protein
MFHNILVSVDGSCHAKRALHEAIDLAEADWGRLTLLTAVNRPPYWGASAAATAGIESLAAEFETEAEQTLRAAADQVPPSIPVTTVLSHKPIREALMERIKTGHYDLLVMGSRGRGALTASVLGSVSHFALNHVEVPVLIVHTTDGLERPEQDRQAAPAAVLA